MSRTNNGKYAEQEIQAALKQINVPYFDYQRLYDATSARHAFMAQTGDFLFFMPKIHGVLEVKSTQHDYRLRKSAFSDLQRAKLYKRTQAGGSVFVAVHHWQIDCWRLVSYDLCHQAFNQQQSASMDLRDFATYTNATEVIASLIERLLK